MADYTKITLSNTRLLFSKKARDTKKFLSVYTYAGTTSKRFPEFSPLFLRVEVSFFLSLFLVRAWLHSTAILDFQIQLNNKNNFGVEPAKEYFGNK